MCSSLVSAVGMLFGSARIFSGGGVFHISCVLQELTRTPVIDTHMRIFVVSFVTQSRSHPSTPYASPCVVLLMLLSLPVRIHKPVGQQKI